MMHKGLVILMGSVLGGYFDKYTICAKTSGKHHSMQRVSTYVEILKRRVM